MSFREVKELRKSGKLEKALTMAIQDLEKEPTNVWNKRSIAWVYHDYLKKYASKENIEIFIEYLDKIKTLELSADEHMIYDASAYQIGKLLFGLAHDEHIDIKGVNLLFEYIKDYHFTKPSEAYSFLYKAFHKCYKTWTNYILFADWWDFNNFSSQDFLSEEFKGKKIMSIVEQAYIAYSKKLLEGEVGELNGFLSLKSINKPKINVFLPKLDAIIEGHPEYQYPPYFKAKLLLALGDEEEVLSNFLPFAKKKRNDFWVWELLADTFHATDERRLACLCKALSLKTPNEFLINTRQKLAKLLIKEKKFQEAKTEIEKIISVRNDNNWKIPQQLTEWLEQDWYIKHQSEKDNSSFYKQHLKIAEEILFADIPEEIVAVEFVNTHKSMLNFVKNQEKYGFFKYAGMIENPKIGDLLSVRFSMENKDGFHKVVSIKKIPNETSCDVIKEFNGNLTRSELTNFGFVGEIFIEPKLIVINKLKSGNLLTGKAILSFNKKKQVWGWKAIEISQSVS